MNPGWVLFERTLRCRQSQIQPNRSLGCLAMTRRLECGDPKKYPYYYYQGEKNHNFKKKIKREITWR